MYKVVIIDDEPLIRKGLRNIINWKHFECQICGEASDGLEGTEIFKDIKPDIIITDIRMPEIDGLSMISKIKEVVPDSKIIILTGYRDFDYARDAVMLGAFEFILKPTKIGELTKVIKRAVGELKCQFEIVEENKKLKELFEQNIPVLREKLLYDMLYGILTDKDEIHEKMELFNVEINEYILALVEIEMEEGESGDTSQYEKHLCQFGIMNTFQEVFLESFCVNSIALDNKHVVFVIHSPDSYPSWEEVLEEKCEYLQKMVQDCFGFTITITISTRGDSPREMPDKLKECQRALEHKFYVGNNSIILYRDLNTLFNYKDNLALDRHQKSLIEAIKAGNAERARQKLDSVVSFVSNYGLEDKEFLLNFYRNTILSIYNIYMSAVPGKNDDNKNAVDAGRLYNRINHCTTVDQFNRLLEEIVLMVVETINNYNTKSLKLVLKNAIDYIESNYHRQIGLNDVAENVYVSTYYVSRIFKKELGRNFVDYLNELRMEKAKELLKDVQLKTYEIADMVGISDAHYFSRLFKKHVGMTPTEYRDCEKQ